ncbi:unannotated protein [freshwater metagenome]|uniref:Unannotated protein n=1 Tax=freshwater metagenome TaxID=449393 RepID=A0A6J6NQZ9_9ZZZZ|nr:hypothetical protein [Actinomycetota bacterium]MSZ06528.1 hypothetical protein [Actinomycetota bacterium]
MSTKQLGIAVIATASVEIHHETSKSLEEMIFETSKRALNSLGLSADDMDAFVLGGNDQIDGRIISIMPSTGPVGGVNHDTTMIASSSEHALIYGYLRIMAGQSKRVLVASWAKPSESVDPDRAELVAAEPYLLRAVGMNETISAALQASRFLNGNAVDADEKFVAWPLTRKDLPGRGDSVHVVILAQEGSFEVGSQFAWICDAGWSTSSYELGARDLADFESLKIACNQISQRNLDSAPENWNAVEIGASSEYAVRAIHEQLPLKADVVVNGTGSLSTQFTSPFVLGLSRMMRAIDAVKNASTPGEKYVAAGIGFNGFAGQGASVIVFSNIKDVDND